MLRFLAWTLGYLGLPFTKYRAKERKMFKRVTFSEVAEILEYFARDYKNCLYSYIDLKNTVWRIPTWNYTQTVKTMVRFPVF